MKPRNIVFIVLRKFYLTAVSSEVEEDSPNPKVVVRDGMVQDVSTEAEKWGVKLGDSVRHALRSCPGLQAIEFSPDSYLELFDHAWSVFASLTPLVEPIDYHQGFLDLTGCERHAGCSNLIELVRAAQKQLYNTTSLQCHWGGGQDKWIARLASSEDRWVHPDEERSFVDQVPVIKLGISEELNERLRRYGICTIGQFLNVPDTFLLTHVQLSREDIQRLKLRNSTSVRALFPVSQVSARENLLWGDDLEIDNAIHSLSEKLSSEVRSRGLQAGMIKINVVTKLGVVVRERKLSRPLSNYELLDRLLRDLLPGRQPEQWREFRVTLSNLTPHFRPQADLWQNKHPLQTASERLQKKFGLQVLQNGTEYSRSVPARFAQLIYGQRGISLP